MALKCQEKIIMGNAYKRTYTIPRYNQMSPEGKKELLEKFRPVFEKHSKEWGQSLAKRKSAIELDMADGLSSYLYTVIERVEPLENQRPPEKYLVRRSFNMLDFNVREDIERRTRAAVMDKMLNATGKIRLIEAEKEVSRETKISLSLVRSFSPSFDQVQRKKKANAR